MADFGPELEDGERYLPAGILMGEDGWDAGGDQQRGRLSRRQSLFSDRMGGFVCYRSDLGHHGLVSAELAGVATTTRGRSQRPRADLSAAHLQQWFWKGCPRVPVAAGVVSSGCVCGGDVSSPALGRVILVPSNGVYAVCSRVAYSFPSIRSCRAQVEIDAMGVTKRPIQARLFPTMESGAVRECGGTGFFLPLYQFQSDSGRSQGRKCDRDGQKQTLYAVVAKKGMPLQSHTEVGLPQDWTY